MLLDQRMTQLTAALAREATTAPLSPQRLARLLTLHQELGDVLTTADKALRGGLSFEGDFWPERPEESEESDMNQEPLLLLIEALDAAGVTPQARPAALNRANQSFAGNEVQPWEAHAFVRSLKHDAPHLFRHQAPAPTPAPATSGYGPSKRKEPPQPPRSVSAQGDALPPMEWLGKLRDWPAAQKSNA
jgi:hypothetical protein